LQSFLPRIAQILAAKKHAPEGFNQGKDMDFRFHGNDGAAATADTSALERQIDEMVYELYGLTDDEIAIVEWEGVTMQIKYSKHIEARIVMREIEYNLPKRIYENAEEPLIDSFPSVRR